MLILVLIKSELYQAHIFQRICSENFQIHLQVIAHHFELTNHDNHVVFKVISSFSILLTVLMVKITNVFHV